MLWAFLYSSLSWRITILQVRPQRLWKLSATVTQRLAPCLLVARKEVPQSLRSWPRAPPQDSSPREPPDLPYKPKGRMAGSGTGPGLVGREGTAAKRPRPQDSLACLAKFSGSVSMEWACVPVLEATQALKGACVSKDSSWPFSTPRLQRPHHRLKRSSVPKLPRPSGPGLSVPGTHLGTSASQTPAGTGPGLVCLDCLGHEGRAGIHAEATAGVPRLASPHCLDLAWLLWPLLFPTMGHDLAEPLPGSVWGITAPWFSSMLGGHSLASASSCHWNAGRFGAGLGPCTARLAGTHPEVHLLLMLKMLHPQQPHTHRPPLAPTLLLNQTALGCKFVVVAQ